MKQLLTINLTTRSSDWTPPTLTFGESITLQIRFTKTISGNDIEPNLTITNAKASIGNVDARPGGGKFALQFGDSSANTTAEVSHDCTPAQLATVINNLAYVTTNYGAAVVKKVNESWLLRFGNGALQVPFQVVNNSLWPVSFGNVHAAQLEDNLWLHELRLVQAPVAFVGGAPTLGVPNPPSFSIVIHGGSSGTGQIWDTVQQLYIPSDFRGTYRVVKGNVRSALLDESAGASDIQAALVAAFGAGIVVSLPFSYRFYVDLGGQYAGTDVAALGVEGGTAPAQDLTLTIPLDRMELALMLNSQPTVTLPLEIRITASEDGLGDPQEVVALYVPVTIQRAVAMPILDTIEPIDWLRLPSPKTYVGPGAANTLVGKVFRVYTAQGDGATTTFDLAHGLATSDVFVFVRLESGRGLVNGTDFSWTVNDDNHVTVTALTGAPAAGTWRISIMGGVDTPVWANDLMIAEDQVTHLPADLSALQASVNELLTLLPANASLPSGVAPINGFTIQLPATSQILFARDASGLPITDPTKLPTTGKPPYMLPAINRTDNLGPLPGALPAPAAGALYTTTAPTLIPGGGHIRGSTAPNPGFVGSDGRILYPVTRSGTKDSYYPTPFEVPLFGGTGDVIINDMMFSSGTKLTLLFKLALQLLNANSEAQWMLAIEAGAVSCETDGPPNTYDSNLLEITWNTAAPIVLQRILLGPALETHGFGCTIVNNAGVFTGSSIYYKRTVAAPDGSLPANFSDTVRQFALRARLFNFDTRNSVTDARGWVSWALQVPDSGNTLGVTIA